jgi:hypothetical protein
MSNEGLKVPEFKLRTPIDTILFFGAWGWFFSKLLMSFGFIHQPVYILIGKGIWQCLVSILWGQLW